MIDLEAVQGGEFCHQVMGRPRVSCLFRNLTLKQWDVCPNTITSVDIFSMNSQNKMKLECTHDSCSSKKSLFHYCLMCAVVHSIIWTPFLFTSLAVPWKTLDWGRKGGGNTEGAQNKIGAIP